jgi:phage shock protein PspC (stress-responsive transcriptional regulator)
MKQFERSRKNGLYRSRNGVLLGVCKGLAAYFEFSVHWVRAILIICLILSGFWPIMGLYVKKPECPVLCTGMNGQCWFGGVSPQAFKAFSLEEAPTFGRGSSLLYRTKPRGKGLEVWFFFI